MPNSEDFLREVMGGLSEVPKTLPCKYFYDERGSQLFEQICDLDEYYVTRADLDATRRNAKEISDLVGSGCCLVELGSGSSTKTRILLDNLSNVAAYIPVDISCEHLDATAGSLRAAYPDLEVLPVCADYTRPIELPQTRRQAARTVIYFPGSTIGNFHPADAARFLGRLATACGEAGALLIGVDLHKDTARLERAYDDAAGVTAAFNMNLLVRINRELGADFDLDGFAHMARYDEQLQRIEMHLRSLCSQTVQLGGRRFDFAEGETIRSEESYKYSFESFARTSAEGGLEVAKVWTDSAGLFSLQYLVPTGAHVA